MRTDDPLVFNRVAAAACEALGVTAIRVARDCPACGHTFPGNAYPPGVGSTNVYPGVAIAFVLCEPCAATQDNEQLRQTVRSQLRTEYDSMLSPRLQAVKA